MKQNKESISNKVEVKKEALLDEWGNESFFKDRLSIPVELKEEIEAQGYEHRFISITDFSKNFNRHHNLWRPYSIKTRSAVAKLQGIDPEGCMIVGDLVLAVRPKQLGEQARSVIASKNARLAGFAKQQAQDLKDSARKAKVNATILEGYEDNE